MSVSARNSLSLSRKIGLGLILILVLIVTFLSFRFFNFEKQGILFDKPDLVFNSAWFRPAFYIHITAGMIAILAGPFQFMPGLRNRKLKLHRSLGKIYLLAVGLSGTTGLIISFFAEGGLIAQTGFMGMSIAWLLLTYIAWRAIFEKDIEKHRRYMMRSYAVTLSAVTLRLGLLLSAAGIMAFIDIYQITAWGSWLLNLAIAELIIRNTES